MLNNSTFNIHIYLCSATMLPVYNTIELLYYELYFIVHINTQ